MESTPVSPVERMSTDRRGPPRAGRPSGTNGVRQSRFKCKGTATFVFDTTTGTVSFTEVPTCTHLGFSTSEGSGSFGAAGGTFSAPIVAADGDQLNTVITSTATILSPSSRSATPSPSTAARAASPTPADRRPGWCTRWPTPRTRSSTTPPSATRERSATSDGDVDQGLLSAATSTGRSGGRSPTRWTGRRGQPWPSAFASSARPIFDRPGRLRRLASS